MRPTGVCLAIPRPLWRCGGGFLLATVLISAGSEPARTAPLYFPGQLAVPTYSDATAVVAYDLNADGDQELVVGRGEEGLAAVDGNLGSYRIVLAQPLDGEITRLGLLPALAPAPTGVAVLTRNPDRLWIVDVPIDMSRFIPRAVVDLEEDPGDLAQGLLLPGGEPALAVTMPGIDRWLLIGETADGWSVRQEALSGDRPLAAESIDLDGDGILELVTADNGPLSSVLSIFGREPSGEYVLRQQLPTAGAPSALFRFRPLGGEADELYVAFTDQMSFSLYVPSAGTLALQGSYPSPLQANSIYAAQFPGGAAGLWTWSGDRGAVNYFRRDTGDWVFSETFFTGGVALDGVLADLNQDLYADLVIANGATGYLSLLFGNSARSFRAYLAAPLPQVPVAARLFDEDGDGALDLVVACAGGRSLAVLRGDGRGHLSNAMPAITLPQSPLGLATLNANGDIYPDVAATLPSLNQVWLFQRVPEGGFQQTAIINTGIFPAVVRSGDLDDDGFIDLVCGNASQRSLTLAFGAGDGSFPDVRQMALGVGIEDLALIDLSSDGMPEVIGSDGGFRIYTLRNGGDRTFAAPVSYPISGQPAALASADFNLDGRADVVVAMREARALSFFENRGDGSLLQRVSNHPLGGRPAGLAAAQIDLVGGADVAVGLAESQEVGIVTNLGDWQFAPPTKFVSALLPAVIETGDLNADEVPDLVVIDQTLALALSMLNIEPNPVPVAPGALTVSCGDDGLEIALQPPAFGAWRLEGETPRGWTLLASQAGVVWGGWLAGHEQSRLLLPHLAAAAAGLAAGADGQFALRLLSEGSSPATATVAASCLAPTGTGGRPPGVIIRQVWPNPFNPRLSARFALERAAHVVAEVFDAAGRPVARLTDSFYPAGEHLLAWDGRGERGETATGIYLLRITAEGRTISRKITLLR